MTDRHYFIVKHVVCMLTAEICGHDTFQYSTAITPNCKDCDAYKEWKQSGLTQNSYREMKESETPK